MTPAILELDPSLFAPEEPMGIVISRGSRVEERPRFSAYVWSNVTDVFPAVEEPKAA